VQQQPQGVWAESAEPKKKVALYFGTFNPIHENHMGIARFALENSYTDEVYFVVNGSDGIKVDVSPWTTRHSLVKQRVSLENEPRLKVLDLSNSERKDMGWVGRAKIFHRVKRQYDATIQLFQIMGQDSYEKAVARSDPEQGNGIYHKAPWKFLVFPRLADDESVQADGSKSVEVPALLARKTIVVSGYTDPVKLSSSSIRSKLRSGSKAEGPSSSEMGPSQLHPKLRSEVAQLYGQAGVTIERGSALPETSRIFVHLLGGPGSGKSSLGAALGEIGFRHISGGDVYRAAKANDVGDVRRAHVDQVVTKVVGAVVHVVTSWPQDQRVSFDGFLPKQLQDFESKLGSVSLLVLLECDANTMLQRLAVREARQEDIARSAKKRVDVYLSKKESSLREETLKSWDAGRGLVHRLDASRPFEAVFDDLKELISKVKPSESSSGSAQPVFDGIEWDKVFSEMNTKPEHSYDWRENAKDMRHRAGSRSMKNFNNLVKSVLIDWATQTIYPELLAGPQGGKTLSVFDVASGRGGDMLKFLQSASAVGEADLKVQYVGVDIAGEQVKEAWRRLEAALTKKSRDVCRSILKSAHHFVADVCTTPLPDDLPWCQLVSIQFALHYSFETEARARNFLKHACERLCSGGLFLCVTVDEKQIASMAAHVQVGGNSLSIDNGLCTVTFPDQETAKHICESGDAVPAFGLRYNFALPGEGIDCDEFLVREQTLAKLLDELDIELLASIPFSSLLDNSSSSSSSSSSSADAFASQLLSEVAQQSSSKCASGDVLPSIGGTKIKCDIYDRLGLTMDEAEREVSSIYKAYVGRRRSNGEGRPSLATAAQTQVPKGKGFENAEVQKGARGKGNHQGSKGPSDPHEMTSGAVEALLDAARPRELP